MIIIVLYIYVHSKVYYIRLFLKWVNTLNTDNNKYIYIYKKTIIINKNFIYNKRLYLF